jgi:hypothetical protein
MMSMTIHTLHYTQILFSVPEAMTKGADMSITKDGCVWTMKGQIILSKQRSEAYILENTRRIVAIGLR